MVVLHQDAIRQTQAVVEGATHPYRIFLKEPQTRGCLAGIENHTRQVSHEAGITMRHSGHTTETLQQVQSRPFTFQQGTHGAG